MTDTYHLSLIHILELEEKKRQKIANGEWFMRWIYVASPFKGDMQTNIQNAKMYALYVANQAFVPMVPHLFLTQFLNDDIQSERELGLALGLQILKRCHEPVSYTHLDVYKRQMYLSSIAPIYTKQGKGGGVYILHEYRSYKNYLTDDEENFLYSLISKISNEEKRILCGIITKFTKNPLREYSSFQNTKTDEEGFDEGSVQR